MKFQIGKNGINEGTIISLRLAFKNHKSVRIAVLKNYAPTKDKVRAIADEIVQKLGGFYRYTTVGFTIILRKSFRALKQDL